MVRASDAGEVSFDEGRIQRYSIEDEKFTLLRLETTHDYYSAIWNTDKSAGEFLDYTKDVFSIKNFDNIRVTIDFVREDTGPGTTRGRMKRVVDEPWFTGSVNFLELNLSYFDAAWVEAEGTNRIELKVYEANPYPLEQYFMGTVTIPQVAGDSSGDKANEIARDALKQVRQKIETDVSS